MVVRDTVLQRFDFFATTVVKNDDAWLNALAAAADASATAAPAFCFELKTAWLVRACAAAASVRCNRSTVAVWMVGGGRWCDERGVAIAMGAVVAEAVAVSVAVAVAVAVG